MGAPRDAYLTAVEVCRRFAASQLAAASGSQNPAEANGPALALRDWGSHRDRARVELETLERNFLGEQNIAFGQLAPRQEAPRVHPNAVAIALIDVSRLTAMNAIEISRLASDHFEILARLELMRLRATEICAQ